MTPEMATLVIQAIPCKIWDQLAECEDQAMEMAFQALKKQVPKEPTVSEVEYDMKIGNVTFRKGTHIYKCECGGLLGLTYKFCPFCGQRIDWEEE